MTGIVDGLMAGMGAAGWVIGFVAVLGGFLIVLGSLWALCYHIADSYAEKKEGKDSVEFDD